MKTIVCKNPKTFKLTKGKQYVVNSESDDYFYISNDKGLNVKYSSDLFENPVIEATATITQELPTAPPPPKTEAQLIETIAINNDTDVLEYELPNGSNRSINFGSIIEVNTSYISCGVIEANNINGVIVEIEESFEGIETDDYLELKKQIFIKAIREVVNGTNGAFVLFSTNTTNDDWNHYYEAMDENCSFSSQEAENPNSGNLIKVWGFATN